MFPPAARPPLPLLITGIAGVAGYHALGYFQRRVSGPGRTASGRPTTPAARAGRRRLQRRGPRRPGPAVRSAPSSPRCSTAPATVRCRPASSTRPWPGGSTSRACGTCSRKPCRAACGWSTCRSTWSSPASATAAIVEDDPTDPVTMYGKTMVVGEQLVREADPAACIAADFAADGHQPQRPRGGHRLDHSRFKKVPARHALCRRGPHAHLYRLPQRTVRGALGGLSRFSGGLSQFSSDENGTVPFGSSGFVAFRSAKAAFFRGAKGDNAPVIDLPLLAGLFHAGGPRRLSLYQTAQIINRVGGYDPDCLIGIPRREAGPLPPRAGNVAMDSSKLVRALGYNPFDPWPLDDRLVPTDPDWHRQRPPGEPRSPEYLHQVLCNNPARRRSPFLPIGALGVRPIHAAIHATVPCLESRRQSTLPTHRQDVTLQIQHHCLRLVVDPHR